MPFLLVSYFEQSDYIAGGNQVFTLHTACSTDLLNFEKVYGVFPEIRLIWLVPLLYQHTTAAEFALLLAYF